MILQHLGDICTAQDLSVGSTDSEDVILMAAVDWTALTDVYWVVETETIATGDGADTYQFQLVLSQEATLDTNIQVLSRTITGYASWSIAAVERLIVGCNICNMLNDIVGTGLSDYPYLGMISTISAGATVSINASISPSPPKTSFNSQTIRSNVGVPS